MLTRKQLWRKTIYNNNKYINSELSLPIYNIPKKKVRFYKYVHTTLIPTKEEINKLYRYYNAHLYFED